LGFESIRQFGCRSNAFFIIVALKQSKKATKAKLAIMLAFGTTSPPEVVGTPFGVS
jgi:hypothetical protein